MRWTPWPGKKRAVFGRVVVLVEYVCLPSLAPTVPVLGLALAQVCQPPLTPPLPHLPTTVVIDALGRCMAIQPRASPFNKESCVSRKNPKNKVQKVRRRQKKGAAIDSRVKQGGGAEVTYL